MGTLALSWPTFDQLLSRVSSCAWRASCSNLYTTEAAEMTIRAVGIFSIVFAAAACAPAAQTARTAIAPKDGPKVTLYASYTGGLFGRSVYAYFNVDRPSYVLIGHTSGEGYIEILYPANPEHQTPVTRYNSIR